jgi:cytochrome c biogenesis protein CcmG, thiol:disulfide interchange protein DsbE
MSSTGWPSALRRNLPRVLALLAVLAVLVLLAYGLLTEGGSRAIDQSLAEGRAPLAPAFDLAVLEPGSLPPNLAPRLAPATGDGRLSLEELEGTPFVLNFWASWCDPCREEAPILEQGWREHGPRGVLYLGLNMQDLTGDAQAFLEEFEVGYPTIRDPGDSVAQSYGATGIPETYFVSAEGRVVGHVLGVVSPSDLGRGAKAAISGRVLGTAAGGARRPSR